MHNLLSTRVWQAVDRKKCRGSCGITRVWQNVMAGKYPIFHCMTKVLVLMRKQKPDNDRINRHNEIDRVRREANAAEAATKSAAHRATLRQKQLHLRAAAFAESVDNHIKRISYL